VARIPRNLNARKIAAGCCEPFEIGVLRVPFLRELYRHAARQQMCLHRLHVPLRPHLDSKRVYVDTGAVHLQHVGHIQILAHERKIQTLGAVRAAVCRHHCVLCQCAQLDQRANIFSVQGLFLPAGCRPGILPAAQAAVSHSGFLSPSAHDWLLNLWLERPAIFCKRLLLLGAAHGFHCAVLGQRQEAQCSVFLVS
jgi:hypothetical protein